MRISDRHATEKPSSKPRLTDKIGEFLQDAPGDWTSAADQLISTGVTRLARDKLALVLAGLADGTAPSTVARKVGVGYKTVARIAETTKRLQPAGTG